MTNPIIDSDGNKRWSNSVGFLHREDGPAIENHNGTKEWYINGKLHRDVGPAIKRRNGKNRWFIKGNEITKEVEQWIIDNNFPEYEEWNDSIKEYEQWNDTIKVLFKLTFG